MVGIFHVFCYSCSMYVRTYRIVAYTFVLVVINSFVTWSFVTYCILPYISLCKLLLAYQVVPASKGLQIY